MLDVEMRKRLLAACLVFREALAPESWEQEADPDERWVWFSRLTEDRSVRDN